MSVLQVSELNSRIPRERKGVESRSFKIPILNSQCQRFVINKQKQWVKCVIKFATTFFTQGLNEVISGLEKGRPFGGGGRARCRGEARWGATPEIRCPRIACGISELIKVTPASWGGRRSACMLQSYKNRALPT